MDLSEPGIEIKLNPGDVITFRGDCTHACMAYNEPNRRVFLSYNVAAADLGFDFEKVYTVLGDAAKGTSKSRSSAASPEPSRRSRVDSGSLAKSPESRRRRSQHLPSAAAIQTLRDKLASQVDVARERYQQFHMDVQRQVAYSIQQTFSSVDSCCEQLKHAARADKSAKLARGHCYLYLKRVLPCKGRKGAIPPKSNNSLRPRTY